MSRDEYQPLCVATVEDDIFKLVQAGYRRSTLVGASVVPIPLMASAIGSASPELERDAIEAV